MSSEHKTFWERIRAKYRVSVVNEATLSERMHMRLSLWNLLLLMVALSVITLALFATLIWYSPLKNYLPGFNEGMREQLVLETARVDSLLRVIDVQDEYLNSFKSVVAGEVEADSVQSLDSLYVMRQQELLAAKSEITEQFMRDYEEKVGDQLTLFDQATTNEQIQVPCTPLSGGAALAMLRGTVVYTEKTVRNGWTIVLQHEEGYMSVYSGLLSIKRAVGDAVKSGDVIGLVNEEKETKAELWYKGAKVN